MLFGYTPKLGDIVRLTPAIHYDKNGVSDEKEYPGKIIYINREHRYFTSATGFVGTSSKTFAEGNRKENTQAAVNWATAILYDLEGVEFG